MKETMDAGKSNLDLTVWDKLDVVKYVGDEQTVFLCYHSPTICSVSRA